jgi:outer membrane biosynthesis protein TonB
VIPRTDSAGVGVAIVGHAAIIAALILLYDRDDPAVVEPPPMEVSFVEEVGPVSTAPESAAAPAPSAAEEIGPSEEPSASEATIPETISPPVNDPVRPPVQPPVETGERRRPDLTQAPVQVRPAAPSRLAPPTRSQPPARNRVGPPQRQPAQSGPSSSDIARALGGGGARQGPSAATQVSSVERQRIVNQIGGLIQPCAARAQPPNAFARSISVVLRVTVASNGSPTAHQLVSSSGTNEDNQGYVDEVVGVALRAVRACSNRIASLPADKYQNGWRTFSYRFRFP